MAQHTVTRLLWAALAGLVLAIPAFSQAAAPAVTVNGYVQARAMEALGDKVTPRFSFGVQRAYVLVSAKINDEVTARVTTKQVASDTGLNIIEAWGQYAKGAYAIKAGLVGVPFGYESPLSSSKLITLERSAVSMAQVYPYTFDRGIVASYTSKFGPVANLAIVNGEKLATAANTDNTVNMALRVSDATKFGTWGVSMSDGKISGLYNFVVGADYQGKVGPATVQIEALQAKNGNVTSNGGYVTVACAPKLLPNTQPYVRYDVYNKDFKASGDYFQRLTLGANYQLNPATKLTLEYQGTNGIALPAPVSGIAGNGQFLGQMQVSF
jgi:hypothetical protein